MKKNVFLSNVEKICGLESGTLSGNEDIKNADFIDSLAMLELIAMLDKDFHVNFTVNEIINAGTFDDLHIKVSSSQM